MGKKSFNFFLYFLFCIFLIGFFFYGFHRFQKRKIRGTYLKYVSKDNFIKKLPNSPSWMNDQIEGDLKYFKSNKINQNALTHTFLTLRRHLEKDKHDFVRYRIVDNNIYMYVPEYKSFPKRQFTFEKALRTLSKITKLPNVDIIYSDEDGTPLKKHSNDFFIMKEKLLQAPILSRAKLKDANFVVLIPDYNGLSYHRKLDIINMLKMNKKHPWKEKKSKAFWRGAERSYSRYNLCKCSFEKPDIINAGYSLVNDVHKINLFKKNVATIEDHLNYKYLPVLDGYMCTYPGYQWRLISNSVCFKQDSNEMQWFYLALKPYMHFIPVKNDMSNILTQIKWAMNHDEKCLEIAQNATDFVLNNLTIEDEYIYLLKVLKHYSKYQDFDKNFLREDTKDCKRWVCIQNRKKTIRDLKKIGYEIFY